jgi:hypothetical protein
MQPTLTEGCDNFGPSEAFSKYFLEIHAMRRRATPRTRVNRLEARPPPAGPGLQRFGCDPRPVGQPARHGQQQK